MRSVSTCRDGVLWRQNHTMIEVASIKLASILGDEQRKQASLYRLDSHVNLSSKGSIVFTVDTCKCWAYILHANAIYILAIIVQAHFCDNKINKIISSRRSHVNNVSRYFILQCMSESLLLSGSERLYISDQMVYLFSRSTSVVIQASTASLGRGPSLWLGKSLAFSATPTNVTIAMSSSVCESHPWGNHGDHDSKFPPLNSQIWKPSSCLQKWLCLEIWSIASHYRVSHRDVWITPYTHFWLSTRKACSECPFLTLDYPCSTQTWSSNCRSSESDYTVRVD